MRILYREIGEQNEITVYDTDEYSGERGRFRILQFSDNAMQGAMDLDQPERILFEYPQAMLHLMACSGVSSGSVFLIGHGIGTIARHCTGRVKAAELDAQVVELSRRYFGYSGTNVAVGDGRELLANESAHSYDFIVLDAFSDKGTPRHLTSTGFFELAASKLDEEGAIIINLMGKSENDANIAAIHATLREVFPNVKAFALPAASAADRRNYILVGGGGTIPYQARKMAGFVEIELGHGYIIED
ncbi:spermidine synthase [Paenibacillus montanisoli]|uniref:Spermidine synthase n=1 Tax=Paenibacillus montanisoli TaxID=2081970 RepID=A0A328TWR9_9BACL|nr:fused MFS/spermidine synthase [Paenibacillus montanisoli]RAP73185.1 spermidine synthase [Paenibacillus montanisoli]